MLFLAASLFIDFDILNVEVLQYIHIGMKLGGVMKSRVEQTRRRRVF